MKKKKSMKNKKENKSLITDIIAIIISIIAFSFTFYTWNNQQASDKAYQKAISGINESLDNIKIYIGQFSKEISNRNEIRKAGWNMGLIAVSHVIDKLQNEWSNNLIKINKYDIPKDLQSSEWNSLSNSVAYFSKAANDYKIIENYYQNINEIKYLTSKYNYINQPKINKIVKFIQENTNSDQTAFRNMKKEIEDKKIEKSPQ